jgi:hypothetical protein
MMTTSLKTASKAGKPIERPESPAEVKSVAASAEAKAKPSMAKAKKPKSKAALRTAAGKKSR